jgi:integrase
MFLPIKVILDRRPRRDGNSPIYIQYCYSSDKRTVLPTGLSIPQRCWNKRLCRITSELPSELGQPEILNTRLQKMVRSVEDLVTFALDQKMEDPIGFLKRAWLPELEADDVAKRAKVVALAPADQPIDLDFFFQLDDYIKAKRRKVSVGMTRTYNVVKERLMAFQKHRKKKITFESFDYSFYEDLISYLTYDHCHRRRNITLRGLKRNSVGTTVKQLQIFLRDRIRRKIVPAIDLSDFKILDEETDAIYLTVAEIQALCKVNLSPQPHFGRFRDMFVLGCYTGLRFSDFSAIRPEDIRQGMLYKKQGKSDHWVVIPLRPEAHDILVNRFNRQVPRTSNEELNRHIKKIAQLAGIDTPIKASYKKGNQDIVSTKPKFAWITTHTCRRSFCTNEFLAGTPPELIMKISGHKSLKDFYKYIRITPEEAGKKIQQIWEQRGEMNSVG